MQQVIAGILFSIGFIFLTVTVSSVTTKNPTEDDKSAALGGIIIGVPAMAGGTWIVWGLKKKRKELEKDSSRELETTFLQLVQANRGEVSVINFAIATKLSLEESKQYLDKKAIELNANFNVGEDGGISYRFFI